MALQTYDIDEDQLKKWWPNVRIGEADSPISSDVATDLINESCAQVSARLQAAGVDDSQITLVDEPVAYHTMRRVVRTIMRPDILQRAHHDTTQAADYDTWATAAEDALLELAKYPERYVGVLYSRHDTSTQTLGLRTDEEARDLRREFDQVTLRKDGKNDFFHW